MDWRSRTEAHSARACATAVAIAIACACAASDANAADAVCKSSYVSAQQLRIHSKLREARADLVTCATADCEDFIHSDCIRWLAEIDEALPTVVVEVVTPDGVDVTGARVSVDGAIFEEAVDGLAHPIDPGPHTIRIDFPGPSAAPLEREVVVHEGEKERRVRFEVARAASEKKVAPVVPDQRTVTTRPVPMLSWIFGGLGVVSLGAGAWVILDDINRAQTYNAMCPPTCPNDSKSDVHLREGIGYGLLGAGVLLEVGAATLYVLRPSRTVTVVVGALPMQGIRVGGSF